MWTTVGCLVVALIACANAYDPAKAQDAVNNFRIKSQNLHVDYIASQLDKLESEFNSLSSPPQQTDITSVKARITKLEGMFVAFNRHTLLSYVCLSDVIVKTDSSFYVLLTDKQLSEVKMTK